MKGNRAACVLLLAALCGSHFIDAATFTETIDSSWEDRWTHSSDKKYNGKFVAEAPPGLSDVALKVCPAAPSLRLTHLLKQIILH